MNRLVIDASIAVKLVVQETGTREALALQETFRLSAPDLLIPECANILWKKFRLGELTGEEAGIAARILAGAEIELVAMRALFGPAMQLAVELDHPAYDCIYLALAIERDVPFVTADERFLREIGQSRIRAIARRVRPLIGS